MSSILDPDTSVKDLSDEELLERIANTETTLAERAQRVLDQEDSS